METNDEPISAVYLFAGPCDDMSLLAHDKTKTFSANYVVQPEGEEFFVSARVSQGGEKRKAKYVESAEWTACFGKRTAVHAEFTGKPPREKAAA